MSILLAEQPGRKLRVTTGENRNAIHGFTKMVVCGTSMHAGTLLRLRALNPVSKLTDTMAGSMLRLRWIVCFVIHNSGLRLRDFQMLEKFLGIIRPRAKSSRARLNG
jgi:hypothetical protein